MDVCGLPKARPIVCNDSPAFQRHHTSVRCAAESSTRFPWVIDTTSGVMIYIRWCCIDLLNPPGFSAEVADQVKACSERYDILEKEQAQKAHVPHVVNSRNGNNRTRGSYDHSAGCKEHECSDESAYDTASTLHIDCA